jgi:hypothetical protein
MPPAALKRMSCCHDEGHRLCRPTGVKPPSKRLRNVQFRVTQRLEQEWEQMERGRIWREAGSVAARAIPLSLR